MDKYTDILDKDSDEFIDLVVDDIHKRFPDGKYDVKVCNTESKGNHLELEFCCTKYKSPLIDKIAESLLKSIQTT